MDVSSTHRTQSPDPRRAVLLTSKINSVISRSDKLAAQKRPSIYESIYRLAPPHQETFSPSDISSTNGTTNRRAIQKLPTATPPRWGPLRRFALGRHAR